MPKSPIYVPLLPEQAQWAIGQLHPVAELPFAILLDEGFETETYVDIFDGGPTVDGRVAMLKSVAGSRKRMLNAAALSPAVADGAPWQIVSNANRHDHRALLRRAAPEGDSIGLDGAALAALAALPGCLVRTVTLHESKA